MVSDVITANIILHAGHQMAERYIYATLTMRI